MRHNVDETGMKMKQDLEADSIVLVGMRRAVATFLTAI